jgi:hypothetical protein
MPDFDQLPVRVRERLRSSPHNLCAACLTAFFLPKVRAQHATRTRALLAAIDIMEAEVRRGV